MKLKYLKDLREVLDNLNITDSELAEKFNKTQSSLSHKFAKDDMRVSEFTDIIEMIGFKIYITPSCETTINGYKDGKLVCPYGTILLSEGNKIELTPVAYDLIFGRDDYPFNKIDIKDLDEIEILKEDGTSVRFHKRYKRLK